MAAIGNSCFWLADFLKSSPLKPLGQMNRNLVESIYGRFSIKMLISSQPVNKHGNHRQFLFLIGWFLKNVLLWNRLAKWMLIYFRSVNKHGHHRQFLFLIGWFLKKKLSPLKPLGQMNRNLVGSIYGRSSMKIADLVPIHE